MHVRARHGVPAVALAVAMLQACAVAHTAAPGPSPPDAPVAQLVRAARADAARQAGVTPGDIEVLSTESVTWRDGSLGCPRAGIAATQALVPGWRIRLQAGERRWDYHASERGGLVACPPERVQDPLPSGRD